MFGVHPSYTADAGLLLIKCQYPLQGVSRDVKGVELWWNGYSGTGLFVRFALLIDNLTAIAETHERDIQA